MGLVVMAATLLLVFIVLEIGLRVLAPDRELHYTTDSATLWYYRPNQLGVTRLADGSLSPEVLINSLGLRGAEPDQTKPSVLLLGDSFTFGSGVADSQTFSAKLPLFLGEDVEVVNGGQPGYGVFQMQSTFERLREALNPQQVIVVVWQGDFLRQPPGPEERAQFFRQKKQAELLKRSTLITHLYRNLERVVARFAGDAAVLRVGDVTGSVDTADKSPVERHLDGLQADIPRLLELHSGASASGRGAIVILWPKAGFASLHPADSGVSEAVTSGLMAFGAEHNIPVFSLGPLFAAEPAGSLTIPGDGHPNAYGHCIAARFIAAQMSRLGYSVDTLRVACTPASGTG